MKKVLIIMHDFYSYAEAIKQGFLDKGYDVDLYFEQPSAIKYLILRKCERIFKTQWGYNMFLSYLYNKIKKSKKKYDLLLVIRGNILNEKFINNVKGSFLKDNAKKVYYTWDSFEFLNHKGKLGTFFDKKFSFDPKDVKTDSSWNLLPLFYAKNFDAELKKSCVEKEFDVSCIAGFNEVRYDLLSKIQEANPFLNIKVNLYINRKLFDLKAKLTPSFNDINKDWLIFDYLSHKEVAETYLKSKAILDITDEKQSGLSMRSIESVGLMRKLVTNNPYIKEFNIYRNVHLIDKDNLLIPKEWLNSDFEMLPEERVKYSLDGWINQLIS